MAVRSRDHHNVCSRGVVRMLGFRLCHCLGGQSSLNGWPAQQHLQAAYHPRLASVQGFLL